MALQVATKDDLSHTTHIDSNGGQTSVVCVSLNKNYSLLLEGTMKMEGLFLDS